MSLLHTVSALVLSNRVASAAGREAWPAHTVHGPRDVEVAGLSMMAMAAEAGTPCVRNAAAVVPGSNGLLSARRFASVVVTRVVAVERAEEGRLAQVWVDAELQRCRVVPGAMRLVGRPTGLRRQSMRIRPDAHSASGPTIELLPTDLREGDVLVVPCLGTTALRDVWRSARDTGRLSADRGGVSWGD